MAQSALLDGLVLVDRRRRQPEQHREDGGTSVPETSASNGESFLAIFLSVLSTEGLTGYGFYMVSLGLPLLELNLGIVRSPFNLPCHCC